MGAIVDLAAWRESREEDPSRLERAVAELDAALRGRRRRDPPEWLLTEVLAIQGCVSLGLEDEAAERAEDLAERLRRRRISR